jgi:hypothetical protein
MGADGGTIAKRNDTIKQKKKIEKLDLSRALNAANRSLPSYLVSTHL